MRWKFIWLRGETVAVIDKSYVWLPNQVIFVGEGLAMLE